MCVCFFSLLVFSTLQIGQTCLSSGWGSKEPVDWLWLYWLKLYLYFPLRNPSSRRSPNKRRRRWIRGYTCKRWQPKIPWRRRTLSHPPVWVEEKKEFTQLLMLCIIHVAVPFLGTCFLPLNAMCTTSNKSITADRWASTTEWFIEGRGVSNHKRNDNFHYIYIYCNIQKAMYSTLYSYYYLVHAHLYY
jgi:hypothetical protein